ncbi:MAG: MCP four helix bundle domain-containing protein, partial [Thermodesulfobacteriota bacterium]
MVRNWGIGKKLGTGFACVGLVAVALGGVGYWNVLEYQKHIQQIAQVNLPSVENLLTIKEEANNIKAAMRTLLDLRLDPSLRKRQYETIGKSRERYQKAWSAYELLPRNNEEAELWKQVVPAWEKWGQDNDRFLELSRKLDALDIGDPAQLTADLREFKANHYKRVAQLRALIYEGQQFQGGEDHTACPFGKWLETYKTSNKELQDLISKVKEPHRKFHEGIRKIKELWSAGSLDDASSLLRGEVTEAMNRTISIFDQLENTAQKAVESSREMEHQLVVVAREAQEKAKGLLDKLIERATQDAALRSQEATSRASFLKIFSLAALASGALLAGLLGLFITRGLSRSLRRAFTGLGSASEQVASSALQVSSSSQSLAEGASEQAASLE